MQVISATNIITAPAKYRSPLRYPGGKQKAISRIAAMLPPRAREYREPMVGGGSVYLYARSISLSESYWINDRFPELTVFWQIVQQRAMCESLQKDLHALRNKLKTAREIKKFFLKAREEEPKDSYQIALLFFFFNRVTFSGTTRAGGFSSAASVHRFTASSIDRLAQLPEALDGTRITNVDCLEVIEAPGRDVFIFLDPPYYTASKLYGRNGSLHQFDHEKLARSLSKTKHRFLITYDDCDEIRKLYDGATIKKCNVREWQLQYGMNNCNSENTSKIGSELFISNY
ncbi:MAG TPA: DNA adenine methylase [Candidatus Obscuribacterales bacterium]